VDSLDTLTDLVNRCGSVDSSREAWVEDSGVSGFFFFSSFPSLFLLPD
jgi:hypothetical protein